MQGTELGPPGKRQEACCETPRGLCTRGAAAFPPGAVIDRWAGWPSSRKSLQRFWEESHRPLEVLLPFWINSPFFPHPYRPPAGPSGQSPPPSQPDYLVECLPPSWRVFGCGPGSACTDQYSPHVLLFTHHSRIFQEEWRRSNQPYFCIWET